MIKNLNPRLAEIGKIKIGKKGKMVTSKNNKSYRLPEKTDYFSITTTERDPGTGDFRIDQKLMEVLGSGPSKPLREIEIVLLFDDIDKNFLTSYALYSGRKKKCWGDGETATRIIDKDKDGKDIEPREEKVKCHKDCEFLVANVCKPTGILLCILKKTQKIGGVYVLRTHSWNTVVNILSSLSSIQQMTGGIIAGLPLKLTLQPKTVHVENKIHTIYTVNIIYDGSWENLRKAAVEIAQIRGSSQISLTKYMKQAENYLNAPESTEEQGDINEEFSPQTIDTDIIAPPPDIQEEKDGKNQSDPVQKENETKLF